MPTFQVFAPCHKDSVLNSAFASNYGDLISNNRIDAWIYGHSHTNIDAEIGGTKVLSNQMGYVFQNEHLMNGFDSGKYEIKKIFSGLAFIQPDGNTLVSCRFFHIHGGKGNPVYRPEIYPFRCFKLFFVCFG